MRAAQFFGGCFLADGGLHQRGPGEKKPAAFGHQNVIAHHRQIRAARDAHAHDRRDLRDAHRAHHGVVAEDAAEIVRVGKNVLLQREKNAGGIHQIDCGDAIFDGDVLRANHFLGGHREKRAGFHGGVVRDDHHEPACDAAEPGDRARSGRAAPFLVHFVGGVDAQLEKFGFGIDQLGDSFAGGEAIFLVLRFDGFRAAALADSVFFVLDFGKAIHHRPAVLLERRRLTIQVSFDRPIRSLDDPFAAGALVPGANCLKPSAVELRPAGG